MLLPSKVDEGGILSRLDCVGLLAIYNRRNVVSHLDCKVGLSNQVNFSKENYGKVKYFY